jgi:hypothetical protein
MPISTTNPIEARNLIKVQFRQGHATFAASAAVRLTTAAAQNFRCAQLRQFARDHRSDWNTHSATQQLPNAAKLKAIWRNAAPQLPCRPERRLAVPRTSAELDETGHHLREGNTPLYELPLRSRITGCHNSMPSIRA